MAQYRVVKMWDDGQQETEVFANWRKLVENLDNFSAKDRREIDVLTIVQVNKGE